MRILIVTDTWEPAVNGVVRTLRMTRAELERRGHPVLLLTPAGLPSLPCPTYPEFRLTLPTRRSLLRRMAEFAPDCLHIATEGPLGWAARAVARGQGWRFTSAYHSQFPEYVNERTGIPRRWTYALLRHFHNAAQHTLAPTPGIVTDLREHGFRSPRLWSRGVDHHIFRPEGERLARSGGPVFLYAGRLAQEKSVDAFLGLDLPGEKWVAGDGPEGARLRVRFPEARWLGLLSGEALARAYRSADVMVFPSTTDTFGLVLAESMACGTPVAAYPVKGPLDVIGDSGGGVMDSDLRRACLQALKLDPQAAVRRGLSFNWDDATTQFVEALVPLASARPGSPAR